MNKDAKIYVAGHRGLVGSAIVRCLEAQGYTNLLLKTSKELDLRDQLAVQAFFAEHKPEYVFLAAAKVGGIHANNARPAEFIHQNLMIECNVIEQARLHGVKRLLFLGSSCIYPKLAPQPLNEDSLLTGPLEPTNSAYALAKIAGVEMCWAYRRQYGCDFIPVMPTNLYGPGDNYDLLDSHVLPALIRKYHLAKIVGLESINAIHRDEDTFGPIPRDLQDELAITTIKQCRQPGPAKVRLWGSGNPCREFLYSDDLADACVFIMNQDRSRLESVLPDKTKPLFNIGSGSDLTIRDLAARVAAIVGFEGETVWDASMPDGTPRKLLDVSRLLALGWQAATSLDDGIRLAYQDYRRRSGAAS